MANAAQHGLIGTATGVGTYLFMCRRLARKVDFGEMLLCAGLGLITSAVPDIVEPALHSHHRQFFHSVTAGSVLTGFALNRCSHNNELWDDFTKILAAVAVTSYLSHLVADLSTPRGLPVLGH